jgi:UDP-sugar pyrophosphorylase
LQYYCEYIKAIESKASGKKRLPLCIMVSKDTRRKTEELLQENRCFGLKARQITLVTQGLGVPALSDNDAKLALDPDDPFKVETKPHGHGDIHALLYKHGVTQKWADSLGIKWAVMFQDTNGLAFHTLPLMLGVSVQRGFIMNSLAVPRRAGQAIGGIAKLRNDKGQQKTINVEYNQLDPMLRGTREFKDGDVNDPNTGYSPFPGNINQLLFRLDTYNKVLKRTKVSVTCSSRVGMNAKVM